MLVGPLAFGVVGVCHVVGRGEIPRLSLPKYEPKVLGVIVAIASHDVECHATENLIDSTIIETQGTGSHEELRIVVCSTLSKIEMIDSAERLDVVLYCFAIDHFTIKSFGHKVSASILFKQTRVGHPDASGRCHQVVCKFNSTVALTSSKFLVFANSIELQQPMLKSGSGIELSTPHFVRFRIPSNNCLRSGTAGRSPNLYDVGESCLGFAVDGEGSLD